MPGDAWRQELAEELIGLARSEAYFRENGINGGKFDHYRPAAVLLRRPATATRAAQLASEINALLT